MVDSFGLKLLPVQIDWVGILQKNKIVREAYIQPEEVNVLGPNRMLNKIDTIYTQKIPVNDIVKSGTDTVDLVLPQANLEFDSNFSGKVYINYVVNDKLK